MLFQGNARLGSSYAISAEIEATGGNLNAFTASEVTFFHRFIPARAFDTAVRSLASQIEFPLFRAEDIEKEMKNVIQEIKRAQDTPARLCSSIFSEVVYGDHPLGKETLGLAEAVVGFTRADFLRWQKQLYRSGNYMFLAVGDITLEAALDAVNAVSFGACASAPNIRTPMMTANQSEKTRMVKRDIQQAHVCFGALVGSASDASTRALELYTTMIDGGMSFPLFQEVRDKRGLCYGVGADITPWSDRGVFQVFVGTNTAQVDEALACIKDVIWNNRKDPHLFEAAKELLIGRTALQFCHPVSILNQAAAGIVFSGAPKSPEEIIAEINAVTLQEVT